MTRSEGTALLIDDYERMAEYDEFVAADARAFLADGKYVITSDDNRHWDRFIREHERDAAEYRREAERLRLCCIAA